MHTSHTPHTFSRADFPKLWLILGALALGLGLGACERKTKSEKAAEEVGEAVESIGEAIEEAAEK